MSLLDCFNPMFQESDGLDPQVILTQIRDDSGTRYFINAQGFNEFILKDFIAEKNCSVVFHIEDGFDFAFRQKFIINLPFTALKEDVIIYDVGFSIEEINKYGNLGAGIYVNAESDTGMHQFSLVHLSNRFPGKVGFSPKGYTDNMIVSILRKAPDIVLLVQKNDFNTGDQEIVNSIKAFVTEGKDRVKIIKDGFSDIQLNSFKATEGKVI